MFDSAQVAVGKGRADGGAVDRAISVAGQLHAAGVWDGRGRLVVHHPYRLAAQLELTPLVPPSRENDWQGWHRGVLDLQEGVDYEVQPLSRDWCRMHLVSEECTLDN